MVCVMCGGYECVWSVAVCVTCAAQQPALVQTGLARTSLMLAGSILEQLALCPEAPAGRAGSQGRERKVPSKPHPGKG